MLNLQRLQEVVSATLITGKRYFLAWGTAFLTHACILLAILSRTTAVSSAEQRDTEASVTGRKLRPGLEGQSTLEWVLIGGILVVIIVSILSTVFKPQLEAILTSIMNTIQQNVAPKQ